jgi:photosystem II stability/assembly factor-like uncharacterized protein
MNIQRWSVAAGIRFALFLVALSALLLSKSAVPFPSSGHVFAANPSNGSRSDQIVSGIDFLSPVTGWIVLSRSGSYIPKGSCTNGSGKSCNTAQTTIYRTDDGGVHWQRELRFVGGLGNGYVWIHFFNSDVGLAAATVGPVNPFRDPRPRSILLRTFDGGKHWTKSRLPVNFWVDDGTITFSDASHGWLWYGGGAMGSMSVDLFHTDDGGTHWKRIACDSYTRSLKGGCHLKSGISFGGDKEVLNFSDRRTGWLTVFSNSGTPQLLYTRNGGTNWHYQRFGLPPAITPGGPKSGVFAAGTLQAPHIFGERAVLPEVVGFYQPVRKVSWSILYLFQSNKAGASWLFFRGIPAPATSLTQYLDAQHWVFASTKATWTTSNGGATWTYGAAHVPGKQKLSAVIFTDMNNGWATADRYSRDDGPNVGRTLLRTTDGGHIWLPIMIPVT